MTFTFVPGPLLLCLFLAAAGCSQLDLAPGQEPLRVVAGTVAVGQSLPAGAEVIVRIVDPLPPVPKPLPPFPFDAKVGAPPWQTAETHWDTELIKGRKMEDVLGRDSKTLAAKTTDPVPFRIEFQADDHVINRGLNLDVRISYDGKVQFRTVRQYLVTLETLSRPQVLTVAASAEP